MGNNAKAALLYEKCLSIYPEHTASLYELALIKGTSGNLMDASRLVEQCLDLDPNNKWFLLLAADIYETGKDYKRAQEMYERMISLNPKEIVYYESLANMYILDNDLKGALKVYDRTETQFGVTEMTSTQKQKIYLSQNKPDKAILEAEKLVETAPGTAKYYQALADLYSKNGRQDEAIATYKKLLEIDPGNAYVQLSMSVYFYEGGDTAQAKESMRLAFSNPDLDFETKARILFNEIAYRNAPEGGINPFGVELAQILENTHTDNAQASALYGDFLQQDNQKEKALEAYLRSLERDPDQFSVWSQVMLAHSEKNDWEAVYSSSSKALELFPSQPSVYFFNGVSAIQLKKYQEGADVLEAGKDFIIGNDALLTQFYTNLGDAYHNLEKHTKSDNYFEKALALDPTDDLVLNNYSYYLSVRGENLERAAEMAKQVVARNPESSTYLDTYAWVLYKKGDYAEAKKYMELAISNGGSEEGVLLEHYGDILFKLDDTAGALKNWNRAKELGGGTDLLDKKIETKRLHE